MAKSDPIERSLDRLGELRCAEVSETVVQEVREFLRNRSNLVVAKEPLNYSLSLQAGML